MIDKRIYFHECLDDNMKEIFSMIFDILVSNQLSDITVADRTGMIVAVSQAVPRNLAEGKEPLTESAEKWIGKAEKWIGRNAYDIEREGVYTPSIIPIVLRNKQKTTIAQRNPFGKEVITTSVPIFYRDTHEIRYVISFEAINIENVGSLSEQMGDFKRTIAKYQEKISQLEKEKRGGSDLIYASSKMERIREMCKYIAGNDANVFITGESGVGKNIIAQYIHENSPRREEPFISINCGAIPENLLESELFGYEKGAFTGAAQKGKKGLIQMADKGTLFLDEIGELPLAMQTKLLHVIQNKHILKVGGTSQIGVDFRLITATNKDLWTMIQSNRFREDLYYRLNVVPVHIPPLRERKEDIVPLSKHFLDRNNEKYGQHKFFSRETMESFLRYDWPGNIRELENLVERLVVIEKKQEIDFICEATGDSGQSAAVFPSVSEQLPLRQALEAYERKIILEAYEKYGSSVKVGRALGIGQTTASKKIRKYVSAERKWE